MDILIREAQIEDLDSVYLLICELEEKTFSRPNFEQRFQRNLNDPFINYWVAIFNESVIRFISMHEQFLLHHTLPTAEIQELIISSNTRSKGVGALLLNQVIETARQKGLEEVEVTSNNKRFRAHEFYKQHGFEASHQKLVYKLGTK